jgi:hypothetical protein
MSDRHFSSQVFDTDLQGHLRNPDASFKLACWEFARAGREVPQEQDFARQYLGSSRSNLMILRLLPDGDLIYEHFGERIAGSAGYNMTSRRLSDFRGEMRAQHLALYARAIRERRPFASLHRIGSFEERPLWERVIMPVAHGSEITALHVVNSVRELEPERGVLATRPDGGGKFAVRVAPDGAGHDLQNGIVGADRHAVTLTRRRLDELLGLSLADCLPGGIGAKLDAACQGVMRRRTPKAVTCQIGMDAFNIAIRPLDDTVTVEFQPRPSVAAA